tara:strand:+ start:1286 stop:2344 length:1059 start_codon:yes stop_codon:yes gene_type:complete
MKGLLLAHLILSLTSSAYGRDFSKPDNSLRDKIHTEAAKIMCNSYAENNAFDINTWADKVDKIISKEISKKKLIDLYDYYFPLSPENYEEFHFSYVKKQCPSDYKDVKNQVLNSISNIFAQSNKTNREEVIDSNLHKMCLEANDYSGCISANSDKDELGQQKFVSSSLNQNKEEPECKPGEWCIGKKGTDFLGGPIIPGWYYKELYAEREVMYEDPKLYKVLVRGKYGRYIHRKALFRYYQDAKAGTSGSSITTGSYNTNCYGDTYSMNCTTEAPTTTYIPGRRAVPAGIYHNKYDIIIDCKDRTFGSHLNGKLIKKWGSIEGTNYSGDKYAKACGRIDELPKSNFSKYSKK